MLKFSAGAFIIGMAVGYVYFNDLLPGVAIFLGLHLGYPRYRRELENKRKKIMLLQFKDLLYSVSASLSLGRNMRQALEESLEFWKNTYDERDPIISEVKLMIKEMRETNSQDVKVLRDFSDRWEIPDIVDFVNVYESLRSTGGDMPKAISRAAAVIGDKISMDKELDAALSEKLTEGRIVGMAPFVMTLAMKLLSPGYMHPMYESSAGMLVAALSLILSAVAIIMIERINSIEF